MLLLGTVSLLVFGSKQKAKSTKDYQMTVALVNEDQGGTFNNQKYNFGTDFVNLLTKNDKINWFTVSRSVAERGIKHKNYDLIVVLPHNFSKKILQFQSPNFKQTDIIYKVRENKNTNLRLSVEKQTNTVLNTLNRRVTNLYFASILFNLHQAQDQMNKISASELQLQSGMKGDVNNPLSQLVKTLSSQNNNQTDDQQTPATGDDSSVSSILNSLGDLSQTPTDFSGATNALGELNSSLDQMVSQVDSAQQQTNNNVNQQLQSLAQSGNSIIQQNNFQTLNFLSAQQGSLDQLMSDDANYISLIQGDEVQTLMSQLLTDPFLNPDTQVDDLSDSLQNQKTDIANLQSNLTKKVSAANPDYATSQHLQNLVQQKLNMVITKLPPNYQEVVEQLAAAGYLSDAQVQSLRASEQWINYYFNSHPEVQNDPAANMVNAKLIIGPQLRITSHTQNISFQLPSYLKLDVQNLLSQLQNAGFTPDLNTQTGLITLQPTAQVASNAVITPQFVVDWSQFSLPAPTNWAVTLGDSAGQVDVQNYDLGNAVTDSQGERLQNVIGAIMSINQAGTLLDFLNGQDNNGQSIMDDVTTLSTHNNFSMSAAGHANNQLFKSLDDQTTALSDNIDDMQAANSSKKLLRLRISKLALSLQSIYQQGIDMYAKHSTMFNSQIDLNTDLLNPAPYQADFSDLQEQVANNQALASQVQTQLNENTQANQQQLSDYQNGVSESKNALQQALDNSKNLLSATQAAAGYVDSIQTNSSDILKNGKSLVNQANSLLHNWSILNDKNKKYSDNFADVMPNTKKDDNASRKIYNNMSAPLKMHNAGTIKNNSSIFPYFLTLANTVIALFAAYLIAELEKYKRPELAHKADDWLDDGKMHDYFMPVVLGLILVVGLAVAYLSYDSMAEHISLFYWMVTETIIQATLIVIVTLLIRKLNMAGVFVFFIFFIQYIFFTPAIGVYVSNQFWLSDALKWLSPFQRIEDQYTKLFEANSISIVFIAICAVILIVGVLINLKVKVRQDEVAQDL
ncbi:type VII secretion protein EsaA [Bombilactobacillus thymidiniphilus]|uniref:Type VII secretion system accessory factor EsaA n=1 Tax=Bombilactobacillus thymidiniphilus TaxID=2923363 RepID=A0ABY4PEZ4_9LACO|nr:type VII secretion protein EsaA [Bombilactobacillus thymidiniphilus]